MELRHLKVFCTVVAQGSFRKASEILNLSQPSVSQYIAALERDYKVTLFRRNGRGVALTAQGKALHSLAQEVLQLSDLIPQHFFEMESLQRGNLAIGATHNVAEILLPGVVKDFRRSFPQINITIATGNAYKIIDQVSNGQLDLGITGKIMTQSNDPELMRVSLGFERLCLAVPKGHSWEKRELTPLELRKAELPIARYTNDHPLGFLVDDYLLRHKIDLQHDMVFNSVYLASRFTVEGVCTSIISEKLAADLCKAGMLGLAFPEDLDKVVWEAELIYSKTLGISFAGWEMVKRIKEAAFKIWGECHASGR